MTHYIALIHKDPDSCYGVSFPDIPGVFTGGDTIEEAMQQAVEVLQFAAEDWTNPDGSKYADPVSWISYFNGGDAVHYFERPAYGYYQSLGCVELPPTTAQYIWPYLTYGTLVTVQGPVA